jgi:hypothetical protein
LPNSLISNTVPASVDLAILYMYPWHMYAHTTHIFTVTMEKGHVNKMVLVGGAAAFAAGGYYGVKFYKSRQESLVQEFAQAMMLYWGDRKASKETIKEYKGKIGPVINAFHK